MLRSTQTITLITTAENYYNLKEGFDRKKGAYMNN